MNKIILLAVAIALSACAASTPKNRKIATAALTPEQSAIFERLCRQKAINELQSLVGGEANYHAEELQVSYVGDLAQLGAPGARGFNVRTRLLDPNSPGTYMDGSVIMKLIGRAPNERCEVVVEENV